jgi:hypothetical protein
MTGDNLNDVRCETDIHLKKEYFILLAGKR